MSTDTDARRAAPAHAPAACSFCGRDTSKVVALVRGPADAMICDDCVEVAAFALARHFAARRLEQLEEIRWLGT